MTAKNACLLFPLSLPLPVSFPHIQPPTGDWRRLVFSEQRELALSVVSCLLPSSSPSSLLATPSPHADSLLPEAAGKPAAKHCSHGTSLEPSYAPVWLVLPCPALPGRWPLGGLPHGEEGSRDSLSRNVTAPSLLCSGSLLPSPT
jgi:hypothetical protein